MLQVKRRALVASALRETAAAAAKWQRGRLESKEIQVLVLKRKRQIAMRMSCFRDCAGGSNWYKFNGRLPEQSIEGMYCNQ
jgi:hypothetical protein